MFGPFLDFDCLLKGKVIVIGVDEKSLVLYAKLLL